MTALNPLYTVGNQIGEVLELHEGLRQNAGARARDRAARAHRHPRAGAARRRLSAPALGRPAPARDDRDGAGLPAEAADRRRADDRARRDDPGADPGAARRAAARDGHGAALHHPRPEPGAPLHPPRRRDGARPAGRDRQHGRRCSATRSTPTRRSCSPAGRSASCSRCAADAPTLLAAQDMRVELQGLRAAGSASAASTRCATPRCELRRGETLGIVGESGSGKTTLGMALLALQPIAERPHRDGRRRASTTPTARRCARCAGACRWCSRTRSRRSARA